MRERPIPFSAKMVLAVLDGRKSQTRRLVNAATLRVRLRHTVRSDLSAFSLALSAIAQPGVHRVGMNQHGAVWAKLRGDLCLGLKPGEFSWLSPHGEPGDRLWIQEAHTLSIEGDSVRVSYHCDLSVKTVTGLAPEILDKLRVQKTVRLQQGRPPRFMPRWASRTDLMMVGLGVERLQAIAEADAVAEGVGNPVTRDCKVPQFAALWDSINADRATWATNPWVYRIEFRKLDAKERAA